MEQEKSSFLTRLRSIPLSDRIVSISIMVLSLTVILIAISQFFYQWQYSMHVLEFLSGTVMLLQGRLFWKSNRFTAVFSLCAAGIIFVCFAVLLFAK